MVVATKYRRKISYRGKTYFWCVKADEDFCGRLVLNIMSEDKRMILSYPLEASISYVVSKGQIFQGKKMGGKWHRFLLPFDKIDAITPRIVSHIIEWAEYGENAEEIEYCLENGIWL